MALTFGFYNSLDGDRRYDTVQISQIFDGIINDGVFQSIGDFFATKPSSGLSVTVGTGRAWFDHTWTLNDALIPLTVDAADPTLTRIDAVVLEVDSSELVRANSIKIVKGTAASAPTKPAMTNTDTLHQHPLAYITVKPGMTEVKASEIEIMVGKSECPFVTAILETTDIDVVFAQWESQFTAWFENVQAQLEGDIATNLQRQIDERVKISDKASSEDAESGIDDGKWMTPKATKDAINTFANLNDVYRVGDVMLSNRENPRPGFVLANGALVNPDEYPELIDTLGVTNIVAQVLHDGGMSGGLSVGLYQIESNGKFVFAITYQSLLRLERKTVNPETPYPSDTNEWEYAVQVSVGDNELIRNGFEYNSQFVFLLTETRGRNAKIASFADLTNFSDLSVKYTFPHHVFNMLKSDNFCYVLSTTDSNLVQIGYNVGNQIGSWLYASLGEVVYSNTDPAWVIYGRNIFVFYFWTKNSIHIKTFNLDSRTVTSTKTYTLPDDFTTYDGVKAAITKDGTKFAIMVGSDSNISFIVFDDVPSSANKNYTIYDTGHSLTSTHVAFTFTQGGCECMGIDDNDTYDPVMVIGRLDLDGVFSYNLPACSYSRYSNVLVLNERYAYMGALDSRLTRCCICQLETRLPSISIDGTRAYIKVKSDKGGN